MSRDELQEEEGSARKTSADDGGSAPRPSADDGGSAPRPPTAKSADDDDGRELDQRISQYLRLGLPAATAICAIVGGVLQGAAAVVLVLAAGALVSVIAIFWASIRTLVGETPLSGADAYALGAPRAEEEQKRAVLRALKDLEFERSVGKISEEDYQALVSKYRTEGKRLIRMLDEDAQPRRQKAEALVAERLFHEGLAEPSPDPYRRADPQAKAPKKKKSKPARVEEPKPVETADAKAARTPKPPITARTHPPETPKPPAQPVADTSETPALPVAAGAESPQPPARPPCASCGTRNDLDAVFCKKCGARQGGDDDDEDEEESAEVKADRELTS